ncbi:MAG TPA: alpha-amylase family glycosyl hydrolase, partial [Fimbriimonas sp.]
MLVSALAVLSLAPVAAYAEQAPHTFTFSAPQARRVFLAGSFNGWRADHTPMEREGDTWKATLRLPYGKHLYKFVVDGAWTPDPAAKSETDGGGNVNSILIVMPPDYSKPARTDDREIARSALRHDTDIPFRNLDRGKLTLSFRARPNDLREVAAIVNGRDYPMKPVGEDDLYRTYRVEVPWDRKRDLRYAFRLKSGSLEKIYTSTGIKDYPHAFFEIDAESFKPFEVPDWVEKGVMYQIFPDRFENGDRSNDPKNVEPWDAKPTWYNFMGGDFAGIDKRLPYLKGLGVGTLYLNPIFRAPSNHRYDADSYLEVDAKLGTNDEFADLNRKLQKKCIRTVLDFAYNHTAPGFFAFDDLLKNQEKSRYKDWYFVHRYPVEVKMPPNYEGWWGFSGMPKLNVKNPEVRDHLLDATRYWVQEVGIDGMRLDVANEVDSSFWRTMRPVVKQDPDKWILGEIWDDGSEWLKGDQFDSVMNYPFRTACLKFIAEGSESPSQFAGRLSEVSARYAPQVNRNLMNLLSSHDTERFLTLAGGDRDLAKLAATVQFTWVGTPSIYYGEELGMEGGKDPDNRRGMRWDLATDANPMLRHYRKLIQIRNNHPVLQSGDGLFLLSDDAKGCVAYARTLDKSGAVVALNRSDKNQTISITLPSGTAFA